MQYKLHLYQEDVCDFVVEQLLKQDDTIKGCGLFLDPGSGKTLITLHCMNEIRERTGKTPRVLLLAPLPVLHNVWGQEIKKFGFDFTYKIASGANRKETIQDLNNNIVGINYELLQWFKNEVVKGKLDLKYHILVCDESQRLKSYTGQRTKSLLSVLDKATKIRRLILTGTPMPKNVQDLMPQMKVVDGGELLGRTLGEFRTNYMTRGGYKDRVWLPNEGALIKIEDRIAPRVRCLRGENCFLLPDRIEHEIWVDMPDEARSYYTEIENELFARLEEDVTLTATNAGAAYVLCKQIANGTAYAKQDLTTEDDPNFREVRTSVKMHDAKLDAIESLIDELNGKPVLIAYQTNLDKARLRERFPDCSIVSGGMKRQDLTAIIDQWNKGELPILCVQPQALSQGVNMQHGGHDIIWMGITDRADDYIQLNARIYRQGVSGSVRIHHVLCRNTVDEAMLMNLRNKTETQNSLLNALVDYWKEKKSGN